jgi:hypothetical protein
MHTGIWWPREQDRARITTLLKGKNKSNIDKSQSYQGRPDSTGNEEKSRENVLPGTKRAADEVDVVEVENILKRVEAEWARNKGFNTCREIEEVVKQYLHTSGVLYTNAVHVDERDQWFSENRDDSKIGAITGRIEDFVVGKSIWANMLVDDGERLSAIMNAKKLVPTLGSRHSTRLTLLVKSEDVADQDRDADYVDLTTNLRTYVLMDIQPGQVQLRNSSMLGHRYNSSYANRETLSILVVEKGDTPKIYTPGLIQTLAQKGITLKEKDLGLPDEMKVRKIEQVYSTHRGIKPHMWPAFMWYRDSLGISETESYDSSGLENNYILAHKSLQEQDPLLG